MLCRDEFLTKPLIKKLIVGLKKKGPKKKKRKAVDLKSLKRINKAAKTYFKNDTDILLFQTVAAMMLFGLFRVSELLGDKALGIQSLQREQLKLTKDLLTISIAEYKHSKGQFSEVQITSQNSKYICPVNLLEKYLYRRGSQEGPLFVDNKQIPLTKQKFSRWLKNCCKVAKINPPYTSHSFRIGGANLAAQLGRSDAEIKILGRWKSNANNLYYRKTNPLSTKCNLSSQKAGSK